MDAAAYMNMLANEIAGDLGSNSRIRRFTSNADLIGRYAEASVRRLISRFVAPLRVSSGGIIYEGNAPDRVQQIDTIIWAPCPAPALFEVGDFALVPRHSAFAFLEIKRSNYPKTDVAIARTVEAVAELIPYSDESYRGALGVICINEHGVVSRRLKKLIDREQAVVLLFQEGDRFRVDTDAVFTLVNFLMNVRRFANAIEGRIQVAWPPKC